MNTSSLYKERTKRVTDNRIEIEVSLRTILRSLAVLFIITFVIISHEIGHAIEMRSNGVAVEVISLGLDFDFIPTYDFTLESVPGTTFRISPFLVGGYASADAEAMSIERLSYDGSIAISRAGIGINFITGFLFILLGGLLHWKKPSGVLLIFLGVLAAFTIVVYALPLLLPVLSLPIIALEIRGFIKHLKEPEKKHIFGFWDILRFLYESTKSLKDYFYAIGVLAMGVGGFNILPVFPLDGGKILHRYIATHSEHAAHLYERGCLVFIIIVLFVALILTHPFIKKHLRDRKSSPSA
jgi:membrane-associated protease RseP (regulator of RpoE activity)